MACGNEKDVPTNTQASAQGSSQEPSSEEPSSEPASPTTEPSEEPSAEPSGEPSSPTSEPDDLLDFSFMILEEQISLSGDILDVVDVDGDGFADIISKSSDLALYWNKGTGTTFEESALLWDGSTGNVVENAIESNYGSLENAQSWSYRYIFGDFNQDGELDVAWTEQFMSDESIWALVLTTSVFQAGRNHTVIQIDTNHISATKIHNPSHDRLGYFSNSGIFAFLSNSQTSQLIANATMYSYEGYIVARDFDEDGDEDFYILHDGGYGFNQGEMVENNGSNTYTSTIIEGIPFSKDLICDDDEMWIPSGNELHFLDSDEQWQNMLSWDSYDNPIMGDFNGDGHLDAIASECENNESTGFYTWSGNGMGDLDMQGCLDIELGLYRYIQDINNDGKEDIIQQYYDSNSTSYQIRVLIAQ